MTEKMKTVQDSMGRMEAPKDPVLQEDLDLVAADQQLVTALAGKRILITGATGLVGSWLIRALACMNRRNRNGMKIYGIIRSREKAEEIYGQDFLQREDVELLSADITAPDFTENVEKTLQKEASGDGRGAVRTALDVVIHGAAVTVSKMMVEQPVETIMTAILGTRNLLELARAAGAKRFVYL